MIRTRFIPIVVFTVLLVTSLISCNEYEKVMKSKDMDYKVAKAQEYFNAKKYEKANGLLTEAIQYYRSTPKFEEIYYEYAMSFYYLKNYWDATIYLNGYVATFPSSPRTEECKYLSATCYDKLSPRYVLDQEDTKRAIDAYQGFKLSYPNSEYIPKIDSAITRLNSKLEKKDFEAARLYYKIAQYKAASISFSNLVKQYPNSQNMVDYKIEAIQSLVKYADNSYPAKQKERYNDALNAIKEFQYNYQDTPQSAEAKKIQSQIEQKLKSLSHE